MSDRKQIWPSERRAMLARFSCLSQWSSKPVGIESYGDNLREYLNLKQVILNPQRSYVMQIQSSMTVSQSTAKQITIPKEFADFPVTCLEMAETTRMLYVDSMQSCSGLVEPGVELMVIPHCQEEILGYAHATMPECAMLDGAVLTWIVIGIDPHKSLRTEDWDFCFQGTSTPDIRTATYVTMLQKIMDKVNGKIRKILEF